MSSFSRLPKQIFHLISIGKFFLYRAESTDNDQVKYILRTAPKELYFLGEEGKILEKNPGWNFSIIEEIDINTGINTIEPNVNIGEKNNE